jgi:hypothetical protein
MEENKTINEELDEYLEEVLLEGKSKVDLVPTEEMAAEAKRGLELRKKYGIGGTLVGVMRARDIMNRKTLSEKTVKRMHSFFSRHKGNEKLDKGTEKDAGFIAWKLWGADAGRDWAARKVKEIESKEEAKDLK